MTPEVILQLIITGGMLVGGVFATIRYLARQNAAREKLILKHNEETVEMIFSYMEKKNGHLERVAADFSRTNQKVGKSMDKLTKEIAVLHTKLEKK